MNNAEDPNQLRIVLRRLDHPTDAYLTDLMARFVAHLSRPYVEFRAENSRELSERIGAYLDAKIDRPAGQDYLFNNLAAIWGLYQGQGRFGEAQQFWHDILEIVLAWEAQNHSRIHKGSIYYFWSQTAILQGEIDKGFFLIHAAYEEDLHTTNAEKPDTPAYKTVSLNFSDPANLLYELVTAWARYLENFLAQYRSVSGSTMQLDKFRRDFLEKPPNRDVLFSFTHTLARLFNLDVVPPTALQGNFASVYESNLLFDLVLVIDAKIYSSLPTPGSDDWKFVRLANALLVAAGISNNQGANLTHLQEVNHRKETDFERAVSDLLSGQFTYADRVVPRRLECDVAIAYCIRNYGAHNLNSFPIIRERFGDIRQCLFNVLFLASEFL